MSVMLSVPSLAALKALQNCEDGEIIFVEDLKQDYYLNEGEWIPYYAEEAVTTTAESDSKMDLYNLNRMLMSQMPDLSHEDIIAAKKTIREFVNLNGEDVSGAYMLLCHDLRYYTIFLKDKVYEEKMEDVVIECLEYFGNIKSIDYNEDSNAIELWFTYEEEPYVAYLFNYNEGVVLCQ